MNNFVSKLNPNKELSVPVYIKCYSHHYEKNSLAIKLDIYYPKLVTHR